MADATDLPTDPPGYDAPGAHFRCVLYPNRSLPLTGFYVMMGGVVLVSAVVGGMFFLAGAWPVTGLFGLDILLLYVAFRRSYRQGRLTEWIRLDENGLRVVRRQPDGRSREWRFEPYWLRVALDESVRHQPRIVLASHGKRLTVGDFLSPSERRELAGALQAALRAHAPRPA